MRRMNIILAYLQGKIIEKVKGGGGKRMRDMS